MRHVNILLILAHHHHYPVHPHHHHHHGHHGHHFQGVKGQLAKLARFKRGNRPSLERPLYRTAAHIRGFCSKNGHWDDKYLTIYAFQIGHKIPAFFRYSSFKLPELPSNPVQNRSPPCSLVLFPKHCLRCLMSCTKGDHDCCWKWDRTFPELLARTPASGAGWT